MPQSGKLRYPVVVPGVGPVPAPGMIVGEAPGRTEIAEGRPFCGRSGALLDDALGVHGAAREHLYITNVFKGDVGVGNRNPTEAEVEDHRDLLESEIRSTSPKAILLLGRVAIEAFIPEVRRVGDYVGLESVSGDVRLYPNWHPSYVLRGGGHGVRAVEFYETIGRFIEYIRS